MRVWSRVALVVVVALLSASTLSADHFKPECPLTLVDSTPPATSFDRSPHGVFRYNSLVFVLRGQVLATYSTNDVGNLTVAREDFIGSLGARETEGGVTFGDGFLYVSSEAGLEIYDLRNTRAGGSAPVLVSRTPDRHYRRLAVSGNRLAGLFPTVDLPCYPDGGARCFNQIEILDITNRATPAVVGVISSRTQSEYRGWNDITFNYGFLLAVSEVALNAFDITNPAAPTRIAVTSFPGRWLVSNGTDFIGVGTDNEVNIFVVRPGMFPFFVRRALLTVPFYLAIDRANPIRFNRHAYWDEINGRLITMIEEVDQMTLHPARTIAFDVFDLTVPLYEGSAERVYEDVTLLDDEEVKHNPVAVGPFVYVIGEETGLQSYGACAQVAGRIELLSPTYLTCNGAEIHGWVTGQQRILSVELFLNNTPLGTDTTFSGPLRRNVSSNTPVNPWRIVVNLDNTARGEYQLRAIGTDILGRRRQFAMKRVFFEGPPNNCTVPRRRAVR
jgi:hypothetical protein